MYPLLILVHSMFFGVAYLLGNIVLQGVFFLLLVFFLLYFSPLFFTPDQSKESTLLADIPSINISPKKSIIIPLILTYLGIYILAFTVTGDATNRFHINIYILLFIFALFSGYMLAFDWENTFFRDALRFHLVCSYITIFAQLVYYFAFSGTITLLQILFLIVVIGFSVLFFSIADDESEPLFLAFLISTLIAIDTVFVYLFPTISLFSLLGITGLIAIAAFEYTPMIRFFHRFIEPSRVLFLTLLLLLSGVLMLSPLFSYYGFVWILPIYSIFLFSVHIRYSNYIAYAVALFTLFFLYSYLFYPLLISSNILSSLLFTFFFPFCIIGSTYFWQERYPYDFSLLHYSSIGFSALTSLYSLIFVAWGGHITLVLAYSLFLLAALFLLSYFRFQH